MLRRPTGRLVFCTQDENQVLDADCDERTADGECLAVLEIKAIAEAVTEEII